MSYSAPRKAKLLRPLTAKVIGRNSTKDYKIGKRCDVMRNPNNPGYFIVWFKSNEVTQVAAEKMPETIEYLDGHPEGWQG